MTRFEAIPESTRRVVDYIHPEQVYLFGSIARGEDGPDSDLDFLAVVGDDIPAEKLRGGEIYRRPHNLEEIGGAAAQLEPSLRQIAEEAATLTS